MELDLIFGSTPIFSLSVKVVYASRGVNYNSGRRVADCLSDRQSLSTTSLSLLGQWRLVLLAIMSLEMQRIAMLCILARLIAIPNK